MTTNRNVLDYAAPNTVPRWISYASSCRTCAILSSAGGLAILFIYAITGEDFFALLGYLWLMIGGVIAGSGFIAACVFGLMAWRHGFPEYANRSKVRIVFLWALLPIAVAIVCLPMGLMLMSLWGDLGAPD